MEATLKAMMRQKKRDSLLVVIRSKMGSEMKVPPRSPNNPQRKMNKTFAFFILLFFLLSLSLFVLFCGAKSPLIRWTASDLFLYYISLGET
jgi:hypothetical protein